MSATTKTLVVAVTSGMALFVAACSSPPPPPESTYSKESAQSAYNRLYEEKMDRARAKMLKRQRSPEFRRMMQLQALVAAGDRSGAENLLEAGYEVDARSLTEDTALMIAAKNGDLQMLEMLLDHGADADAQNRDGTTALMRASRGGYPKLALRLLQADAWVNAVDRQGRSALVIAAESGSVPTVWLLLRVGSDLPERGTALDYFLSRLDRAGHGEVAEMIRQAADSRARR